MEALFLQRAQMAQRLREMARRAAPALVVESERLAIEAHDAIGVAGVVERDGAF